MTSLTIVRVIEAPPAAVFAAFVEPDKIALWWGPDDGPVTHAEVDARPGGRFLVRFRMLDGSEHGCFGIFEVFEPPHHLAMSWSWEDEDTPASRVQATLKPVGAGHTELTFVHAKLADDATRDSHEQGWNGALDKLQRKAGQL
ncbi:MULTISPECIES: SRPBCC domain-containing protein [unclassified Massilia]|uniref:SRPBCC family protein n=1 Tax=unclassified Massilia TaxID=2609279 RepID=UPI0017834FF5|nr:SRPBCC domain-containing protein [Massilia sp. CFBP 13647]MBD8672608.1 SRPBCC domain-containing protein [Massilia sp. CFBP 13721]